VKQFKGKVDALYLTWRTTAKILISHHQGVSFEVPRCLLQIPKTSIKISMFDDFEEGDEWAPADVRFPV
jgi:hypothetical protein